MALLRVADEGVVADDLMAAADPADDLTVEGPERVGSVRRFFQRRERLLLGVTGVLAILVFWQVAATNDFILEARFTSYPTEIARSLVDYFREGTGWRDLRVSSREFAYGFTIALAIGIPVGVVMGWFRIIDELLDPAMSFLYNSPRIALAPLFIIWFGIGDASKVAVVILTAVFPIIISARGGVANTDPVLVAMARSYGASSFQVLRSIVLPAAVPGISSGIRIAIGQGLLGVVLAEFIASTQGLGYTVNTAAANFQTERLFSVVVIISTIGMTLTAAFRRVEAYFDRWRT